MKSLTNHTYAAPSSIKANYWALLSILKDDQIYALIDGAEVFVEREAITGDEVTIFNFSCELPSDVASESSLIQVSQFAKDAQLNRFKHMRVTQEIRDPDLSEQATETMRRVDELAQRISTLSLTRLDVWITRLLQETKRLARIFHRRSKSSRPTVGRAEIFVLPLQSASMHRIS